jgi:3-hydroxyisobutyrate dehydrogenase-like beta-hydroxyacid dehydrogenase
MKSFGILGVGFMGRGMARNVLMKGATSELKLENVFLYDNNRNQIEQFLLSIKSETASQPKVLESPKNILEKTNVVALSLPSEEICDRVLFNSNDGVISTAVSGLEPKIIIDHSTYSKKFVVHCSEKAKQYGNFAFVDAPVSGGPQGAWNGTLSIMVGCEEKIFQKILPYLKLYSAQQKHFGAVGKISKDYSS